MASTPRTNAYFRSLYLQDPNFRALAARDPHFRAILKPNGQLDFTDPAAVKQLTKTLLEADFGLKIELPDDRLCPPVPNRHNYILWLKSLLDSSSYNDPGGKLSGLDIGTGASCIYPLLGCAQRPWSFIATDIDEESLEHARANVALNDLQSRIKVVAREQTDPLIPLDDLGVDRIDFLMTNPPFYQSEGEMLKSAAKKSRPPHSACTGAPVEMVCEGGEALFVARILEESLLLKGRVQWYTAMFGMISSLETMVDKIRERGIDNYAVTEFVQGNKTRRWALAWSFGPMRPSQDACRGIKATPWRKILPMIVETELTKFPIEQGVSDKGKSLSALVGGLDMISWEWDAELLRGTGRARENVWSRAWRRKRKREELAGDSAVSDKVERSEICVFGFSLAISVKMTEAVVECRWREGHDEAIYTSFCGFIKTRFQASI
ncbi:hypothetical protein BD289DRAFT_358234 [Coniella lustricola]|uniref:U6 small nuclear RNA (adenine-(43)-N(6))-methyltransferase n=1 Tax=Coniella lustricola TaxID=2025994 RepID=A0A2T3ANE7_9PEZI|nr:hypothetical protein BD289DRAFT_358234 [Coniella lustricola]